MNRMARLAASKGARAVLVEWGRRRSARQPHAFVSCICTITLNPDRTRRRWGAFHGAELPYVFDTLDAAPDRPFGAVDRQIAERMAGYWVNFVADRNPQRPWAAAVAGLRCGGTGSDGDRRPVCDSEFTALVVPHLLFSNCPMLADTVVVVHFLIVLFIVAGLPLIYCGSRPELGLGQEPGLAGAAPRCHPVRRGRVLAGDRVSADSVGGRIAQPAVRRRLYRTLDPPRHVFRRPHLGVHIGLPRLCGAGARHLDGRAAQSAKAQQAMMRDRFAVATLPLSVISKRWPLLLGQ